MTRGPSLKYARVERERRFLLPALPSEAAVSRLLEIDDRYLVGLRLRLRRVEEAGFPPVFKLGQKVRLDEASPTALAHTTMYLGAAEYSGLLSLPAQELVKTRRLLELGDRTWAVDAFHGPLAGLVLVEVDLGADGSLAEPLAIQAAVEVSEDERFTGGALAATSGHELRRLIGEYGLS